MKRNTIKLISPPLKVCNGGRCNLGRQLKFSSAKSVGLISDGTYHFSTDNGVWKYKNDSEIWTIPEGKDISMDVDGNVWVTVNTTNSTGKVRRYSTDSGSPVLEATGQTENSWDEVRFHSITMMADGGCVAVYTVVSGSSSTFFISGWDKDGTRLFKITEGNFPAGTSWYFGRKTASNSDLEFYLIAREGSLSHLNLLSYQYPNPSASPKGNVIDNTNDSWDRVGDGATMSPDGKYFYTYARDISSSSNRFVKVYQIDTDTLSTTNTISLGSDTDILESAITVDEDGRVYVGYEDTTDETYTLMRYDKNLANSEVLSDFGSKTIAGIFVDTNDRIFVLSSVSDGFGGFNGTIYIVDESDGSLMQLSSEGGRAEDITGHPGAYSINN